MARAGSFRDRVTFLRLLEADDGYGNTVTGWRQYLVVWADVLESPGREAVAAGRVEASRTATMRVRRSAQTAGLTEADRASCRDRLWNIRSVGAVGRDMALLEMVIEAGVAL